MKREPQTDEISSITSVPLIPVEPEHKPGAKQEKEGLLYPDLECDKDGWPVVPPRNDRPPLWK